MKNWSNSARFLVCMRKVLFEKELDHTEQKPLSSECSRQVLRFVCFCVCACVSVCMHVSLCVHVFESERDLRTMADIRKNNEVLYRIEIFVASSKFNGFPWIFVSPCYQYRTLGEDGK